MRVTKKSIFITSILLIALSIPYLLTVGFQIRQWQVRHEMLEKLEQENLQQVKIAKADVKWFEEGEELLIGDRMFDVKEMTLSNDTLVLKGLYDDEETSLKQKTKSLQDQQQHKIAQKLMAMVMCSIKYSLPSFEKIATTGSEFHSLDDVDVFSALISVPFPPPKA